MSLKDSKTQIHETFKLYKKNRKPIIFKDIMRTPIKM